VWARGLLAGFGAGPKALDLFFEILTSRSGIKRIGKYCRWRDAVGIRRPEAAPPGEPSSNPAQSNPIKLDQTGSRLVKTKPGIKICAHPRHPWSKLGFPASGSDFGLWTPARDSSELDSHPWCAPIPIGVGLPRPTLNHNPPPSSTFGLRPSFGFRVSAFGIQFRALGFG